MLVDVYDDINFFFSYPCLHVFCYLFPFFGITWFRFFYFVFDFLTRTHTENRVRRTVACHTWCDSQFIILSTSNR